jgi:hypothetical protein
LQVSNAGEAPEVQRRDLPKGKRGLSDATNRRLILQRLTPLPKDRLPKKRCVRADHCGYRTHIRAVWDNVQDACVGDQRAVFYVTGGCLLQGVHIPNSDALLHATPLATLIGHVNKADSVRLTEPLVCWEPEVLVVGGEQRLQQWVYPTGFPVLEIVADLTDWWEARWAVPSIDEA